jgi:transposase
MGNKYSTEFKVEAVKRVVEGGETSAKVSRELGINTNSLRDWVKTYKEDTGQPFVGSGNLRDMDAENRRLCRELRDLKEENEILKKATAIFARERKTYSDS